MRKQHILVSLAAATGLLTLASAAAAPADAILKATAQQKLGKSIAALWEAKIENKGINEAYEKLRKEVDKLDKSNAKKLNDEKFLKSTEDWEKAFYYANAYSDKGIKKGRMVEGSLKDWGDVGYAVHTPKAYSAKKGPYPLLISIPPKGQTGTDHLTEHWVEPVGRDTAILASCNMPSNERMWTEQGTSDNPGGVDTVLLVLNELKSSHAVDVDRVYLAGFQEGVAAAVKIAAMFPHVFAGVIGRAGDLEDVPPANFRNLPCYFAGAGEKCTAFQTKAKEQGIETVTLNTTGSEADIWAWLGELTRDADPVEVSLSPVNVKTRRAYWLHVDGFDPEAAPIVHAKIDRATNTINVDADGIATVTIFFNDLMVDLAQPVKVICNGTENEDFIPRNLNRMLDFAFLSGDSGRVYVNSHTYDVPTKKSE